MKENNIKNIYTKGQPEKEHLIIGRDWFKGFFQRNPQIGRIKVMTTSIPRAPKLTPIIVNDFLGRLGKVVAEMNLESNPERIYNVDENHCHLTAGPHEDDELAESAIILACGNASGQSIPPMVVFKGERVKNAYAGGLPKQSVVTMSSGGGYMTCDLFLQWLDHFALYKPNGNVVVIFAGWKYLLDIRVVDWAEKCGVTLFALPSELQPLCKAVFPRFKRCWSCRLSEYFERFPGEEALSKERFGEVFAPVWEESMSAENLKSGFKAAGVYPCSRIIVPKQGFGLGVPCPVSTIDTKFEDKSKMLVTDSEVERPSSMKGLLKSSPPVLIRKTKKMNSINCRNSVRVALSSSSETDQEESGSLERYASHPPRKRTKKVVEESE